MAKPKSLDPLGYVPVFFLGIFVLGILLAISIVTYVKAKQQTCDLSTCVSDTCITRECIQSECQIVFTDPFCCYNLTQCVECDPFGQDESIKFFLNTTFTDAVTNSECTSDIYVQGNILSNANVITRCFSTYPNSRCNSTFSVLTANKTVLTDFIFSNNRSYINIDGLIIERNGTIYYNGTNSTMNIGSLSINGTLLADTLESCINSSVTIGRVTFYPNGTVVVSNANAVSVSVIGLNYIDILSSVFVQGVLFSNGTVQGYSGGQPSNLLINNVGRPVWIANNEKPGPAVSPGNFNVNGTVGTTNLVFYPNNCTSSSDCIIDYYYEWQGYVNATGIPGNVSLDIKVVRFAKNVYFRVSGISSTATSPVTIAAVITNSTGPTAMNYTNFLSTTKKVTKIINVWVQSLNKVIYGIASIDTLGVLRIQFDPYYTLASTAYYFNTFTMQWTLYN